MIANKDSQPECAYPSCHLPGIHLILDANPPGYYCSKHTDICDYCKHATTTSADNKFDVDGQTLTICPKCQHTKMCPNCKALFTLQNPPLKNKQGQIIGCTLCTDQCSECDEFFPINEMYLSPTNDRICPTCFKDTYAFCFSCGNIIEQSDAIIVDTDDNSDYCCEYCCTNCTLCDTGDLITEMTEYKDENYCSNCISTEFTTCEYCNELILPNDGNYYDDEDSGDTLVYCDECYANEFHQCAKCGEQLPNYKLTYDNILDEYICDECQEKRNFEIPEKYQKYTDLITFKFSPISRYSQILKTLVPISIQDLKKNHPHLFSVSKELILFSKGKIITQNILDAFEEQNNTTTFGLEYSGWNFDLQRSIGESQAGQLVLNIIVPPSIIHFMKKDRTYELFDKINETSKESGHPYKEDQLGWARLELDEQYHYILVDEIQTDHMNALHKIFKEKYRDETYAETIKHKWKLSDDEFIKIVNNLKEIVRPFPDIAIKAISDFARKNGFDTLYWHTYESGKKIKSNQPPKSLYTTVPKRNFFTPTNEKPFLLDGDFFSRVAEISSLNVKTS